MGPTNIEKETNVTGSAATPANPSEGSSEQRSWDANMKRLFDEMMHESLEAIRRSRLQFDKITSDAQQFDNQRQVIANQALANAVENANLVSKQAVRHTDLAVFHQFPSAVEEGMGNAITIDPKAWAKEIAAELNKLRA